MENRVSVLWVSDHESELHATTRGREKCSIVVTAGSDG